MYSKIIFTSCTGSAQKYAGLLSSALGIPAYKLEDAPKADDDSKVIYVGWLFANRVMGYNKAKEKYNVGALVAVGMSTHPDTDTASLKADNNVPDDTQIFPVQGAFHMKELPLHFRLMMKLKNPSIVKMLESKPSLTEVNKATLNMAKTGDGDPVEWNIDRIVAACK